MNRYLRQAIIQAAAYCGPNATQEEIEAEAQNLLSDWIVDAQHERETQGIQDSPCIESCDDAGTGEGQFHGRM